MANIRQILECADNKVQVTIRANGEEFSIPRSLAVMHGFGDYRVKSFDIPAAGRLVINVDCQPVVAP